MGTFEKNVKILAERYVDIAKRVKALDIDEVEQRVRVSNTKYGLKVPKVWCRGRWWNLNSRIDPELAAAYYAKRYPMRIYQVYFIFGFSDGRHVRHMLRQCDDTNHVVIYVPDIELFGYVCKFWDIADVIGDERVTLYSSEVGENIEDILSRVVGYSNVKLLKFCILPDYDVLYTRACQSFMDDVTEKIQMELVHKGTRCGFARMIPQHTLYHMKNLIYQRNIEQLRRVLESHDFKNIPAIIVSAGPSLDKNVGELRKAQGKAFIMVVDAALRTVLKAGIQPDIVCTIDPELPDRFFENLDLRGIVWSTGRLTRPCIMERYGERVFYQGGFTREWNEELSKELGYVFPELPAGGSVTSEAFLIAQYLGFRKVVLVGQDMAFTGGVSHTVGIEGAFGDNDEYIQSRMLVQVESVDGGMLETDFQMWFYKQWFEKMIRLNKDRFSVIDATEGGARIEGTIIQTLRETIQKECMHELPFYEIACEIPPAFSKEQQELLIRKIKNLKQEVMRFKQEMEAMIVNQEKLLGAIQKGNVDQDVLLRGLESIREANEKVNGEDLMILLMNYAQEEEYTLSDSIYTEEDMGVDGLIERSLALYRGYRRGLDLLEEDIDEYIIKD